LRTADRLTIPKWHRLMSFAVAGVLAATVLAFVPATPASAAGCYAASCEGKDPSTLGCAADAYTVAVVYDDRLGYIEGLELRYSPACRANWARLSARSYYPAWVSISVVNDANRNNFKTTGSFRNSYRWSPMMDGSKRVFASAGFALDSGGSGNFRTGAY
jgi:hypothetical protein